MSDEVHDVVEAEGYAVANIDALGDRYGFRKIRRPLGVTAFGINAIVLPPGHVTGVHCHDEQEEVYFVHRGVIEFEFGQGRTHVLGAGGVARVDPATPRRLRNLSTAEEAVYVCAGGKDGYVGRDGRVPEGAASTDGPPGAAQ